ncbi:MAG: transglycosylase domain-containing protein, partial [Proteobacteria bacterium]|nr:transglycosylase domain-containing protein [Pseudomonadota bacterium]
MDRLRPLPIADFSQRSFAQVVVDKDGLPLRAFPDSQGVWRYPVQLSEISPLYLEALINYEDRYFYRHFGVNPLAVIRALGQWIKSGELVSGASTLTMQVARILKPHKKSFTGKFGQMFRALQLEWHYSKSEILTFYINYAPFGGVLEGVQAASYAYFGKLASDLSYSEAALLAVLPQAPSRFRPDRHPQRAQNARNKLLTRLLAFDVWTKQVIREAKQEPVWAAFNSRPIIAPLLTRRLSKQYPDQQLIKSTIDIQLQTELELLIKDYLSSKSAKTSAALLLLENSDLSTRVYIGSADFFNDDRAGHVDMIKSI